MAGLGALLLGDASLRSITASEFSDIKTVAGSTGADVALSDVGGVRSVSFGNGSTVSSFWLPSPTSTLELIYSMIH